MSFDIFERQEEVRRKSRMFLLAFIPATMLAILLIYMVISTFLMLTSFHTPIFYGSFSVALLIQKAMFNDKPTIFAWTPFLTICLPVAATVIYVAVKETLTIVNEGAHYIAQKLGAKIISINPKDPKEQMLINVVEEMAIASGIQAPTIYILHNERGINAMTAGLDHEDAILVLTKGALEALSRDELQAVVAHEYGHIINGDCAVGCIMAGGLSGLMFIAIKGRNMMINCFDDEKKAGSWISIILGLMIYCAGLVGKWTAEIVQAAFSRQREFLADALAVQLTRNPSALAGALKKIGGYRLKGRVLAGAALLMNPFFIANPLNFAGLFRSHPPLDERIIILDPAWDGDFPPFALETPRESKEKMKPLALVQNPIGGIDRKERAYPKLARDWKSAVVLQMLGGLGFISLAQENIKELKMPASLLPNADNPAHLLQEIILFNEQTPGPCVTRENRLPLIDALEQQIKQWPPQYCQEIDKFINQNLQIAGHSSFSDVAALWRLKSILGIKMQQPLESCDYISLFRNKAALTVSIMAWVCSSGPDDAEERYNKSVKRFHQWSLPALEGSHIATADNLHQALLVLSQSPKAIKDALLKTTAENAADDNVIQQVEYEFLSALAVSCS